MRIRFTIAALVASLAALASLAAASPSGKYHWITPVAGWAQFSDRIHYPGLDSLQDAPAVGLRIGGQFNDVLGLELAGSGSMTKDGSAAETKVTYLNGSANLTFTPVVWGPGSFYLAAGGGATRRTADGTDALNYGTFEQALGWNGWLSDKTGYRIEARNILNVPQKNWGTANKADQQYWAGLTWAFGGKPVDTDMDGVPDRKDRCPSTPAGAVVDAGGCPMDSDGDGVFDGLDKCPGTPKGARVDATGCPTDTDGDGVLDGLDKCADTPKGATVDATGCTKDSDGDGVVDGLDKCANTPAGATVDESGCPVDGDGDGVPDGLDKCPGTPQGAKVDSDGCPIVVTEKETELLDTGMIRLQNVNFEVGKSDLLPEDLPILDEVGPILRKWPQLRIEVGGHTDASGGLAKNMSLSEARAGAVRTYLLQKFTDISADQLVAKGYGPSKPLVPNTSKLNMAKNRRVEFVVLNRDVLKKEVEKRKMLQK